MPNTREKLIELVGQVQDCGCDVTDVVEMNYVENITLVDHLIANDVVPVVRCKDCLWFDQKDKLADVFRQERHCYCTDMNTYMPESGFCSSGERKENG